jgi:hypothetical protein
VDFFGRQLENQKELNKFSHFEKNKNKNKFSQLSKYSQNIYIFEKRLLSTTLLQLLYHITCNQPTSQTASQPSCCFWLQVAQAIPNTTLAKFHTNYIISKIIMFKIFKYLLFFFKKNL